MQEIGRIGRIPLSFQIYIKLVSTLFPMDTNINLDLVCFIENNYLNLNIFILKFVSEILVSNLYLLKSQEPIIAMKLGLKRIEICFIFSSIQDSFLNTPFKFYPMDKF